MKPVHELTNVELVEEAKRFLSPAPASTRLSTRARARARTATPATSRCSTTCGSGSARPTSQPSTAMSLLDARNALTHFVRRLVRFRDRRRAIAQLEQPIPLTEPERVHAVLDQLGLPREHEGAPLPADGRLLIMVGRYADHEVQLRAMVNGTAAANQALANNIRAAHALLVGAPHASDLRIRRAIAALETSAPVTPPA